MNIDHLSTSTPASKISSAEFRDDMGNNAELEAKALDDILRNSPAAEMLGLKGSLPEEEEESVPTPEESEEVVPEETSEDAETDSGEESDQEATDEEDSSEDDKSTQEEQNLPSEEDIDWEYKVPVTVDGKTEYLTLEEIRKGYATDKHLSQKGREIGELKKQLEQEREQKLNELVQLGTVIHEELTAEETSLGKQYHELTAQIEKARDDGDTYTARELKEKREEIQEKYWNIRNKREEKVKAIAEQIKSKQAEEQQKLLDSFSARITEVVPEFNEKVATSIREFAIKEGIPADLLDHVYSPEVVKFINDYRKLKESKEVGAAKRKVTPPAKSIPVKKGTPQTVREKQQAQDIRAKVLTGQASREEETDFLKRISSVSKRF